MIPDILSKTEATASISCSVQSGTRNLGWPLNANALPGLAVPIEELFRMSFTFDAFALAHAIPEGMPAYRLTKDYEHADSLRMVLLFGDFDAHKLEGQDLAEWKDRQMAKARELFTEHPGLMYATRKGYRTVWRVDMPWSEFEGYAKAWYQYLDELGFSGVDHTAGSFGRHMRLPHVVRDGKVERPTVEGSLEFLRWEAPARLSGTRTGKKPDKTGPRPPRVGRYPHPTDLTFLEAERAGLVGKDSGGIFPVFCPTEKHNGGELTSATAVWENAGVMRFHCFKASCAHVVYSDWAKSVQAITHPEIRREDVPSIARAALKDGGIGGQLAALDITTGGGKSHAARAVLSTGGIHEGIRNAILSPTNDLASQHRRALVGQGRDPLQIAGVGADIPGRDVCVQPKTIAALHAAHVSSKYACQSCPSREGCNVAKGLGGNRDDGLISSHSMVRQSRKRGGNAALNVVWDEFPELLETFDIDVEAIPKALDSVTLGWRKEVEPWALALMRGEVDERARAKALDASETPESMRVPSFDLGHFNASQIKATFAPVKVAQDVRKCAHESARFVFSPGKIRVTMLSDAGADLKASGGTILAAGLPTAIVRALRPDAKIHLANVEDAPEAKTERQVIRMGSKRTTGELDADFKASKANSKTSRLEVIVWDIARRACLKRTLIVTGMSLEKHVREILKTHDLEDLFDVAHFGAVKGLDNWMSFEVFATIGDHYQNLDSVTQEADYFGVDVSELMTQKLRCELEQAHGRARDCQHRQIEGVEFEGISIPTRTANALHLHYGSVFPGRWYSGNTTTETWDNISEVADRSFDHLEADYLVKKGMKIREVAEYFVVVRGLPSLNESTVRRAIKVRQTS